MPKKDTMQDYDSILKEEFKEKRLEIRENSIVNGTHHVSLRLVPRDINECPGCGSHETIRYGHRIRKVTVDAFAFHDTNAAIDITRFMCKACGSIFHDRCAIVGRGETIARIQKVKILDDLRRDVTFTEVARMNSVSVTTVENVFRDYVDMTRERLPEVMCWDEFKNLRSANGKYAFLILDPIGHTVVDVLPDRKSEALRAYFREIPVLERERVKYIVTDMYDPYREIARVFFPKATLVIDAFHYCEYVYGALDRVRIRIMGEMPRDSAEYRTLKRYWKAFLMRSSELPPDSSWSFQRKERASLYSIMDDILNSNEELNRAYDLKEAFVKRFDTAKANEAEETVDWWISELSKTDIREFSEIRKTFVNWKDGIVNSFLRFGDRRLHNGYIEGTNNRIKVIKRISYGYTNFSHFRKRIMYVINDRRSMANTKEALRKNR